MAARPFVILQRVRCTLCCVHTGMTHNSPGSEPPGPSSSPQVRYGSPASSVASSASSVAVRTARISSSSAGGGSSADEHEDVSRARARARARSGLTNTGRRTSHGGRGRRRSRVRSRARLRPLHKSGWAQVSQFGARLARSLMPAPQQLPPGSPARDEAARVHVHGIVIVRVPRDSCS
jgi:hypothetical protein